MKDSFPPAARPIVFFDGHCCLCHRLVRFILREDRPGRFSFAPLQGETARQLLPPLPESPATLVLWDAGEMHTESGAALRILGRLGGIWRLTWAYYLLPLKMRDAVYRWLARNRYRWFGRTDTCPRPAPQTADRFLP